MKLLLSNEVPREALDLIRANCRGTAAAVQGVTQEERERAATEAAKSITHMLMANAERWMRGAWQDYWARVIEDQQAAREEPEIIDRPIVIPGFRVIDEVTTPTPPTPPEEPQEPQ